MKPSPEFLEQVRRRREELARLCGEEFPEPEAITLEIGCGHGHFLTAYAEAHPNERCVGIDILAKRVRKGEAKANRRSLDNLCFIKAEALEFLDVLPEHVTLQRTFLLFLDPWPKKRHWKNRIVQAPLLDRLAARSPQGQLYFRTDHEGYFEWAVEHICAHPEWEIDDEAPWPFEAPSFFQDLMESWQSLCARRV